jgi:two-component system response regulator LytT
MKIIIIEDEKIAADDLIRCIKEVRHNSEIITVLSSVSEATEYLSKNTEYDIIFSDIQLGDGTCFEIYKKIEIKVPIIFCTAYDDFLMEAFKFNGIDYILKPFDIKTIEKSIKKFEMITKYDDKKINELVDYIDSNDSIYKKKYIVINQKDRILSIAMNDIALAYLKSGIANVISFDESEYITYKTLEEIENLLDNDFFRANRQFILNRHSITEVVRLYNRKIKVRLNIPFSEEIIISKGKSKQFLDWLSDVK